MFNLKSKKLNIDPKELEMGIIIEKEHTNDPDLAKKIAIDHLKESPKYYTFLKEIEDKMPKR